MNISAWEHKNLLNQWESIDHTRRSVLQRHFSNCIYQNQLQTMRKCIGGAMQKAHIVCVLATLRPLHLTDPPPAPPPSLQSYSQCEQLLDAESSAGGGGVYCPASPDPEMSHADSAVQWELSLLSVSDFMQPQMHSAGLQVLYIVALSIIIRTPSITRSLAGIDFCIIYQHVTLIIHCNSYSSSS